MAFDHHGLQWAAVQSITAEIGRSGEALRNWVRRFERDRRQRAGAAIERHGRIETVERDVLDLRQGDEIFGRALTHPAFAEFDHRVADMIGIVDDHRASVVARVT